MALKEPTEDVLLCLFCRKRGHSASSCPTPPEESELGWFISKARRELLPPQDPSVESNICQRCKDLDLLGWMREDLPLKSDRDLGNMKDDSRLFKTLGSVESVIFRDDCGLCRCVYALTPTASRLQQKVKLVRSWTMYRLEASMAIDTPEKRRSSHYFAAILDATETGLSVEDLVSTRGDGLCAIDPDPSREQVGLTGCKVDAEHVDMNSIRRWIETCQKLHPFTCGSLKSTELERICLIDTKTRQIVPYAAETSEYLALSYVWGGVNQDHPGAGKVGTVLEGRLCQTIEDAMTFVNDLGKQYLWVDSLCIDQHDEQATLDMISIMSLIYQNAYATIIAFTGKSADSGLPRVGRTTTSYRHLQCSIDGICFTTLGPTLSQLCWHVPLSRRAWTFQEAILSPRCIYIGDYQVIMECNGSTFCESLDETSYWVHNVARDESFYSKENHFQQLNTGVLRSPFSANIALQNNALGLYATYVRLYSSRALTKQSDALLAFSGILQALARSAYTDGFFWALPITKDTNWGLIWEGAGRQTRRRMFPSWSWLSWQGTVWPGRPTSEGPQETLRFPLDIKMWIKTYGKLQKIFDTSYDMAGSSQSQLKNDPIPLMTTLPSTDSLTRLRVTPSPEVDQLLCIETLALSLPFAKKTWKELHGNWRDYIFLQGQVQGVEIYLRAAKSSHLNRDWQDPKRMKDRVFILLAREVYNDRRVIHFLLMLEPKKHDIFERNCLVQLEVPKDNLSVLSSIGLVRRQVLIA